MKAWSKFILFFSLVYLPSCSFAVPVDAYQVEVIVFSHISAENLSLEHWRKAEPIVIPANALDLDPEQILPPSNWRLKTIQQSLISNHDPIILHLAWQEKMNGLRTRRVFHLSGGETYGNELPQLNGLLSIKLQHYFDIYFNLQFLMPIDTSNSALVRYNFSQKLRMRSNELNYIDHPLYGIFIEIFPLSLNKK